jgi:hypothetical protein
LIKLDKGRNLISQWHFRCPYGLDIGWDRPLLGTQALIPQHRQLFKESFHIVYFVCDFEILVYGSSCFKFFRKLLFGLRRVSMSDWRLVEYKEVCCLMFLWAIGLKTYSILYNMFLNESFDKYFSYVNSFVKSYCVS